MMKMKTAILVATSIALLCLVYADDNIMPSTFKEKILSDNSYEYIISKYLTDSQLKEWKKTKDFTSTEDYLKSNIPDCAKVQIDINKNELKFFTKSRLNDPANVINTIARTGPLIPYWDELLARDNRSKNYVPGLYYLDYKMEFSQWCTNMANYDWKSIRRDSPIKLPFKYSKGKTGALTFNRTLNACMDDDKFAMRIYDDSGKFIWEDLDNIYGNCLVSVIGEKYDINGILIYRDDHGKVDILFYGHKSWKRATDSLQK